MPYYFENLQVVRVNISLVFHCVSVYRWMQVVEVKPNELSIARSVTEATAHHRTCSSSRPFAFVGDVSLVWNLSQGHGRRGVAIEKG